MQIDDKLLARLESLAMIEVPEEKKESIKAELGEIVNFVENLNSLEVEGLEATFTTLEGKTPMREDAPMNDEEISALILKHAPQSAENYFIVPKIIE
jgi:aspartyl-tRNA(Asn)/glutamyl-tRNA(Gln) amidotransferase subunit C